MITTIEEHPQLTARALRNVSNLPVSTRTVIRRLHEGGKTPRVGRLKEAALLNPAVRARRLQWAEEQGREWAWWHDRTVFVDECIFESSPCHRTKSWRSTDENGPFFNYVRRSGRVSLAVFGGICGNEVLPLFIIPGSFTAEVYRDLLENLYWPVLQEKFPNQSFRYVQDNCPAHKGKVVQEWLAEVPQLCDATLCLPPYSCLLYTSPSPRD